MIKRSVPVTLSVFAQTAEYAEGVKDGIMYTLECLMHECDVIMRKSPEVEFDSEKPDSQIQYKIRARFTVREKMQGMERGKWIKINSAFLEEKMNDQFDTNREWKSLTDMEVMDICNFSKGQDGWFYVKEVEAKLKEKNNG